MIPADYITIASLGCAGIVAAAAYLDKLPWAKKHPKIISWLDEAAAVAGQMRLNLPPGTTLAQAKTVALNEAKSIAAKYPGAVSEADAAMHILGTLGSIVQDGHILPPSAQPAVTDAQAILAKLDVVLSALPTAPAAPVASAPVPAP